MSKDYVYAGRAQFGGDDRNSDAGVFDAGNRGSSGVTRVMIGADHFDNDAAAPELPSGPSVRTSGGAMRWNSAGGGVSQIDTVRVNTRDGVGEVRGDVLATARDAFGQPIPASLVTPSTMLVVDGVQMTAAIAEQLGIITRHPATGLYVSPNASVTAQTATAQDRLDHRASEMAEKEAAVEESAELFAPAVEAAFSSVIERTDPEAQIAVLEQIIKDGKVTSSIVERAASVAGINPSEMAAAINGIHGEFVSQAQKAVEAMGVTDFEDFSDFAQSHAGDLERAIRRHAMERSTAGYKDLAARYVEALSERDPDAILSARFGEGVRAFWQGSQIVISTPTGTYGWKEAVRLGIVKVSRG